MKPLKHEDVSVDTSVEVLMPIIIANEEGDKVMGGPYPLQQHSVTSGTTDVNAFESSIWSI